ncbi:MAG: LacI family transcriptional regulator [Bacteroidales bacterium]|jgi:LacI family transcriptional regulator|nr:LacI family transcriptional regulator [Bacteroidales bacterium]MCI2145415.1 LacI family transcriptional regulator [Bacteroidales bacterium]
MEKYSKITIKDVAKKAGISKGTVDRVIHNRGEVSEKSKEKVMKAIEELGYEPNIFASMLASNKEHLVACLMPQFHEGDYWAMSNEGVTRGIEMAKPFNVKVIPFFYNQYDIESFKASCEEVIKNDPSGVVLAPMFKNETRNFVEKLAENRIPYVYIDSKIEEDDYFAYFGMPMYQSGYLCADLLTLGKNPGKAAVVRIVRDKNRQSDPTVNRREGFMDYMSEHFPDCEVQNVFIYPNDTEGIESTLEKFFSEHPDFKHIVMFNSRVYLITNYLEKHPDPDRRVLGYDSLKRNLNALRTGTVQALITQHADMQSFYAIQALTDYIVLKKTPAKKDNYMHMDLLTRFNIDYY